MRLSMTLGPRTLEETERLERQSRAFDEMRALEESLETDTTETEHA